MLELPRAKAEGSVLKVPNSGEGRVGPGAGFTKDVSPAFTAAIPHRRDSGHLVAEKVPQLSSGLSPSSPSHEKLTFYLPVYCVGTAELAIEEYRSWTLNYLTIYLGNNSTEKHLLKTPLCIRHYCSMYS